MSVEFYVRMYLRIRRSSKILANSSWRTRTRMAQSLKIGRGSNVGTYEEELFEGNSEKPGDSRQPMRDLLSENGEWLNESSIGRWFAYLQVPRSVPARPNPPKPLNAIKPALLHQIHQKEMHTCVTAFKVQALSPLEVSIYQTHNVSRNCKRAINRRAQSVETRSPIWLFCASRVQGWRIQQYYEMDRWNSWKGRNRLGRRCL